MRNLLIILTILITLSSCKLGRYVVYNFADIKDYKKFHSREIKKGATQFHFANTETGRFPKYYTGKNAKKVPYEEFLKDTKTVAFIIIKNDTIQYEKYFNHYNKESIVPSFSMAKSVNSILIGCAIDEGLIKSVKEPITNYIPELKKNGLENVTIEHLLQMTSGIKFSESYSNPFGEAANFYYGTNLRKEIKKLKPEAAPGTRFKYVSGDTQLLGLILERALKNKTLSSYLEEKLWIPLEMEYNATWSLDRKKNGLEKTFCCLNARARDFAKIGRLYLNKGNWNGKQIVSASWVEQSTKIDTTNGSVPFYQYQWWIPNSTSGDFMAEGILGQFIYVNPQKNLIIVRLGKKEGKINWTENLVALSQGY